MLIISTQINLISTIKLLIDIISLIESHILWMHFLNYIISVLFLFQFSHQYPFLPLTLFILLSHIHSLKCLTNKSPLPSLPPSPLLLRRMSSSRVSLPLTMSLRTRLMTSLLPTPRLLKKQRMLLRSTKFVGQKYDLLLTPALFFEEIIACQ